MLVSRHAGSTRLALVVSTIALMFTLSACCCQGEPVPEDKMDFVGNWEGVGMFLTITADGGLNYERTKGTGKTSVNAPIQRWGKDEFEAGIGPFTTVFKVDEPPEEVDGEWRMTVDGVELKRTSP